ncbi:hypothetical protein [Nocardia wallacei]|uniref:PASTA domain-containing protein n=1 Tax=Nocardia wallacei TaxID=480035 RepID=A0A7G1KBH9_9NOCA|nr:hypothetical protein [Nocardia wallacei]BCK52325.1 hypothetical protein NWFMUON74_00970 [Nocardia wallacei]
MKCPRPASRERRRRAGRGALLAGLAAFAVATATGCDSRVGIEGTDYADGGESAAATLTAAQPVTPAAGETAVTVSLESADSAAADALTRWAIDLQELPQARLVDKCWTMAPRNVETMYTDKQAVLAALAEPGVDDGTAIVWKGPAATVVAQRSDIATGYACPRVFPSGSEIGFTDADARHTVRRYLARAAGTPLDPADREATHPLVCAAGWDPTGSGRSAVPPLVTNPNKLTGVKSFVDDSITSEQLRTGYLTVSAPVTDATGTQQERTFTVKATDRGYCVGDVSS